MLAGLVALAAVAALGGELSVEEIVKKAEHMAYYQGKDGRAEVHMTITDAQGRTRTRRFVILRRDVADGADQKFYVYFLEPADVRKMVYMVWKHTTRDDDRWLYLPAAGSHFFYEDVSGRSINDDTHTLVETTPQHYVINNIPKDPKSVEFSSYKVWIDRKNFMPVKAEYLDKEGKKYRVVEALEIEEIQGYPTVVKSRVRDLRSGGQTVSEFTKIRYDVGIPDSVFTERYLRRAPRRYLR